MPGPTSNSTAAKARYEIDPDICTACAGCAVVCPAMAISVTMESASVGPACISCGACFRFCPVKAIRLEER